MKTTGCFLAFLVFLVLAAPANAVAGDITLFGGFQNAGKLTLSSAGSTVLTEPANVGIFGVRYKHGGFFSPEHTIAFAPNFLDSQSKAFFLNSNLVMQAPAPVVRPYVTAGLGTVITSGSGVSDIGVKFALNYGGGAKLPLMESIGARFDVRGYSIPRVQSQTLNIVEVTFGLVFSN
ncbi:MAG TPA: hypothetical protein VFY29_21675 [Terriglobia bacterium]|nr:hypothetical protein [Terriglobia bacterium]